MNAYQVAEALDREARSLGCIRVSVDVEPVEVDTTTVGSFGSSILNGHEITIRMTVPEPLDR